MNYEIIFSLRMLLQDAAPEITNARMVYDGVTLSNETKPFVTIKDMQSDDTLLSAGRHSYKEIYHYQVGLFAQDIAQRMKLAEKIQTELSNPDGIPLYNENLKPTGKNFVCDVEGFTPIDNDDSSVTTYDFHGYFDVSVTILRNVGEKEFSQ